MNLTNLFRSKGSNITSNLIGINSNKNQFLSFWDYIPALLANIFSVIFSLSIVLELKNVVSGYVLIILSIFVVLFLIQNEATKVIYVRKTFKGIKNAVIPLIITFLISISLASIGIYLFVNKATDIKDNSNIEKNILINDINNKFQIKITEISNNQFEQSSEYQSLNKELIYWKSVSAATLDERNNIRLRIDNLQKNIISQRSLFDQNKKNNIVQLNKLLNNELSIIEAKYNKSMNNSNKNNFITYIFLSLIIITEFATIILNKNIAEKQIKRDSFTNSPLSKRYIATSNILKSLYMTAKNNVTDINLAKYSPANKFSWEDLCLVYNQFISIGILDEGEVKQINDKKLLVNNILLSEAEAQKKLAEYYEIALNS